MMTYRSDLDLLPNWVVLVLMSHWLDKHDEPLTAEAFRRAWDGGELDEVFWTI